MEKAEINDIYVDYLEVSWQEDLSPVELAERFHIWLNDSDFIEQRLPDLKDAAFCQLSIDPS